jgi:hypothetical protein
MLLLPSDDGHNWPKHVKAPYKYVLSHWTVLLKPFYNIFELSLTSQPYSVCALTFRSRRSNGQFSYS